MQHDRAVLRPLTRARVLVSRESGWTPCSRCDAESMYDFLRGTVANLDAHGRLSLAVQGVGYLLRVSDYTRSALPLDGSEVVVMTRLVVRDDDLLLFGFADHAERAAFDLLTAVQGVGPAVALAILSTFAVTDLCAVLVSKDVAALKKVKGVGAKSAERMVLELHDKVERIPVPLIDQPAAGLANADQVEEARQALIALGFSASASAQALADVGGEADSAEALLRLALSSLR